MEKIVNIITVKHGTKYGPEYVNKMYNMVYRNITMPFRFYCVTDDSHGLEKNIRPVMLPEDYQFKGWWCKPYIFKTGLFKDGVNFYIDLDMVILRNIDCFMTHMPGQFIGLRNYLYLRENHDGHQSLASGIMRWENNTYNMIHERLQRDDTIVQSYHGDQDYIWHYHRHDIKFYPDEWTMSYKWDHVRDFKVLPTTKILVFHGEPRPHQVTDEIVLDNWI